MSVAIRPESPGDERAISELITTAFRQAEHSGGAEAAIVERLRKEGALTISLIAEDADSAVGHIALSPVEIAGATGWYGLGPIAVLPSDQGQGVGSALIERALAELRDLGANGCVVLGEPGFYARFGFRHDPELTYPGPPPEYFQQLILIGEPPAGPVAYHPAFGS